MLIHDNDNANQSTSADAYRLICIKEPGNPLWDGSLDSPLDGANWNGHALVTFGGWFVHRTLKVIRIRIRSESGRIISAERRVPRPPVTNRYQQWCDASAPGWRASFRPEVGRWIAVSADLSDGTSVIFARTLVVQGADPPVVFVHIAKTAGTTINSIARACVGDAAIQTHLEGREETYVRQAACTSRFSSGHLTFGTWQRALPIGRFRTAILLRDPIQQFVSHLAWIRNLAEPTQSERLHQHEEYIRELAYKLASIDISDAASLPIVLARLNSHQLNLLDNVQVRYLLSRPHIDRITATQTVEAMQNLLTFQLVGLTENLSHFVGRLRQWLSNDDQFAGIPQENVSDKKFGLSATNKDFLDAVMPYITADTCLYHFAKRLLVKQEPSSSTIIGSNKNE